jgi:hypothetical protein
MEAMRKSWTNERLDHFAEKVDRRFDEVDRRFDEVDRRFQEVDRRFDKVDHELRRINDRLDGLTKAMIFGTVTMSTSVLAGFVAIAFTTA